jgi:hypothetical protein
LGSRAATAQQFPNRSWDAYAADLRLVAERRFQGGLPDLQFLEALGYVSLAAGPSATPEGRSYVEERFVRDNQARARELLAQALRTYLPAATIVQLLAGVPRADRAVAETVLRLQGYGEGLTDRGLGSLLGVMNGAGLIRYAKGKGLTVLAQPTHNEAPPPTILISPKTPFANRVWLRRILEECSGFIYWLDKHFLPVGLEALWEACDGNRISEVRILSLSMPDNSGPRAVKVYRLLQQDLAVRSITLEWRFIDSQLVRDDHDRWIIGSKTARNVPNVNAIFSGQYSELNSSSSHVDLRALFDGYWSSADRVDPDRAPVEGIGLRDPSAA